MNGSFWAWYSDLKRILAEYRKVACDCGTRGEEDPADHASDCPYRSALSASAEPK